MTRMRGMSMGARLAAVLLLAWPIPAAAQSGLAPTGARALIGEALRQQMDRQGYTFDLKLKSCTASSCAIEPDRNVTGEVRSDEQGIRSAALSLRLLREGDELGRNRFLATCNVLLSALAGGMNLEMGRFVERLEEEAADKGRRSGREGTSERRVGQARIVFTAQKTLERCEVTRAGR